MARHPGYNFVHFRSNAEDRFEWSVGGKGVADATYDPLVLGNGSERDARS